MMQIGKSNHEKGILFCVDSFAPFVWPLLYKKKNTKMCMCLTMKIVFSYISDIQKQVESTENK